MTMEETRKTVKRRQLLKALATAGGVTAASALLPGKWSKPNIGVGALPAHAQVTPELGTGDLQVTLTWDTGLPLENCEGSGRVDIDLWVEEPDGTRVYYGNDVGPTATLDYDNTCGFGPENIFVPTGHAAAGTYKVWVVYFVDAPGEHSQSFSRTLPSANYCLAYRVADVTFPAGTIAETTGTFNLCAEMAGAPMAK
jgi:uncharacterized protein YfaP (DUF2135 family)